MLMTVVTVNISGGTGAGFVAGFEAGFAAIKSRMCSMKEAFNLIMLVLFWYVPTIYWIIGYIVGEAASWVWELKEQLKEKTQLLQEKAEEAVEHVKKLEEKAEEVEELKKKVEELEQDGKKNGCGGGIWGSCYK